MGETKVRCIVTKHRNSIFENIWILMCVINGFRWLFFPHSSAAIAADTHTHTQFYYTRTSTHITPRGAERRDEAIHCHRLNIAALSLASLSSQHFKCSPTSEPIATTANCFTNWYFNSTHRYWWNLFGSYDLIRPSVERLNELSSISSCISILFGRFINSLGTTDRRRKIAEP